MSATLAQAARHARLLTGWVRGELERGAKAIVKYVEGNRQAVEQVLSGRGAREKESDTSQPRNPSKAEQAPAVTHSPDPLVPHLVQTLLKRSLAEDLAARVSSFHVALDGASLRHERAVAQPERGRLACGDMVGPMHGVSEMRGRGKLRRGDGHTKRI